MHPNVVWLMTDEQRRDSLGCYGSPWAISPRLDAIAAEGTLFEWAATPSPLCMPARASLLTGSHPTETGIWSNRTTADRAPLLEHLTSCFAEAGYRTASFGKSHYGTANRAFAREREIVLSPRLHYFDYAPDHPADADSAVVRYPAKPYPWIFAGRFPGGIDDTPGAAIVREATAWVDAHPRDEPFLLQLSFNAPHTPVAPPAPYDTLVDPDDIAIADTGERVDHAPAWEREHLWTASRADRLSPEQIRRMRGAYYGEVAFADVMIGRFLDALRDRGLLDDTIIVYVSDHGTHLGDFGLVQKQTFYEPVVAVPYVFWAPGRVAAGARIKTPVETRTLLPTVIELCGLDLPRPVADASLAATLTGGAPPDDRPVFSEFSFGSWAHDWPGKDIGAPRTERQVMVRSGPWKLSLCADPEVHDVVLVNLEDDPGERRNRAGGVETSTIEAGLVAAIIDHLEGAVPPIP